MIYLNARHRFSAVRLERISLRSAFPKRRLVQSYPLPLCLFRIHSSKRVEYAFKLRSVPTPSDAQFEFHPTPSESEPALRKRGGMENTRGYEVKKIQCWVVRPEWYRLLHVSSSGMQEIRTAKAVHTKRRAVYAAVKGGHLLPSCACFPLSTIEQIRNRQKRRWQFAFHEGFEFRNYGRICYPPWKQQLQSTFIIHSTTKMLFILSC